MKTNSTDPLYAMSSHANSQTEFLKPFSNIAKLHIANTFHFLASKFVRNIITKNPMMIVSQARFQRLARETTMMMHPLRFMGVGVKIDPE